MDFDCRELWDWWNAGMFPRLAHYICRENTRPTFFFGSYSECIFKTSSFPSIKSISQDIVLNGWVNMTNFLKVI